MVGLVGHPKRDRPAAGARPVWGRRYEQGKQKTRGSICPADGLLRRRRLWRELRAIIEIDSVEHHFDLETGRTTMRAAFSSWRRAATE